MPEKDLAHFVSDNLLNMNVTGIVRYWTKKREATEPEPETTRSRP